MEDQDRVSREAHDRVTRERDEATAKLKEATAALTDLVARENVRSALRDRVADPDSAADLLLPHLRDVAPADIGEALKSNERLVSMVSLLTPKPAPAASDDTPLQAPLNPGPQSSFSGPNPGASGGQPTPEKIRANSPEFNKIGQGPDGAARIAELASQGLIEWRTQGTGAGTPISSRFQG